MIMDIGGMTVTSNHDETGVYLNVYPLRGGRSVVALDMTPKEARKLGRKLQKYAETWQPS